MHTQFDFSIERYKLLKRLGFNFKTTIDIGANMGQWFQKFNEVFLDTEILSVEGNPACEEDLKNVNPNYLITLLGEDNGDVNFFLNSNYDKCSGGSIYKEKTVFYENCIETTLPIRTLDSLNKDFEFIKIDVQGAELDIIKGGLRTILNCSFLQLELSILQYNEGSPLISEIVSYLNSLNFVIYDIVSHLYWNNRLNQVDVIFINKSKLGYLLEHKN